MLKRNIPERVWFFDMEWVPDAEAARRLFTLDEGATEAQAIERLWAEYPAKDGNPRPFLKYLFSRVVSISFLSRLITYVDGELRITFRLQSLPKIDNAVREAADEAQIISEFLCLVGERRPQLVGFNSYESDVQVLVQRGIINELSASTFCQRPEKNYDPGDYFRRWDNEEHLDLIKLFSGGAMSPRLNEIAKLCGFPGKMEVDGHQVVDLWLAGDLRKIVEYNQLDVLNTYLVWLRVVHFCGKVTEEDYIGEQEEFRAFLEQESQKPGNQHLGEFLNRWEA